MKLFVVDPHTIYRRGLSVCLEALPEVEAVGQAGSVRTAWEDEALFAADLVIVDHAMPGGPDFVGAVAESGERAGRGVHVGHLRGSGARALQSGAAGVLRKDTLTTESLANAVRAAVDGTGVVASELLRELLDGIGGDDGQAGRRAPHRPRAAGALADRRGASHARGRAAALLFRAHREERPARRRDEAQRPLALTGRRARRARGADLTSVEELVAGRRIVICAGSGGVGKTTTAAALAMGAAAAGQKVAVVTIDPARRLATALGLEELGNEPSLIDPERFSAHGIEMRGELWALMLDAKRTFDELIEHLAPDARTRDDVLANRIYQQLSSAVAGSQEFTAIAKLYELDASGDFDLIVLDTPPSRNALDFLDAPQRLTGFFQGRAVKVFLRPAGFGGRLIGRGTGVVFGLLRRVTGVDLLEDLSVFFRAMGGMIDGFVARAERVGALLADPGTTFLLVTSPRRDPVEETIYFHRRLRDGGCRSPASW